MKHESAPRAVGLCLLCLVLSLPLSACHASGTFAQRPGFAAWFAAHPPAGKPASPADQVLLRRFRPRLWVGPGQDGPIDFYRDYIADGTLYGAGGRVISRHVTRTLLNRYKDDSSAVFVHRPGSAPTRAVVFGRVTRSGLPFCTLRWTFLTYNFVFRTSGLPADMASWETWPLKLLVNLNDWHQLDPYVAASVVLDADRQPVALLLQQHNDQRSYIFGHDLKLPRDGRVRLIAAERSNELYPYSAGRKKHRVVEFMSADDLPYLVTGAGKPWLTGDDITDPVREIHYRLAFLPPDDAFYVFKGRLGAKRLLPGRSGPPGADYYTLPMFMNRALQLVAFHWREDDTWQMKRLETFLRASRAQGYAAVHGQAFQALCRRFTSLLNGTGKSEAEIARQAKDRNAPVKRAADSASSVVR